MFYSCTLCYDTSSAEGIPTSTRAFPSTTHGYELCLAWEELSDQKKKSAWMEWKWGTVVTAFAGRSCRQQLFTFGSWNGTLLVVVNIGTCRENRIQRCVRA